MWLKLYEIVLIELSVCLREYSIPLLYFINIQTTILNTGFNTKTMLLLQSFDAVFRVISRNLKLGGD